MLATMYHAVIGNFMVLGDGKGRRQTSIVIDHEGRHRCGGR